MPSMYVSGSNFSSYRMNIQFNGRLPWWLRQVKNLPAMQETQILSLGWEDPWRREWLPTTPVFLPGEFHGQRSLGGYNPWGHKFLQQHNEVKYSIFISFKC